MNRLDTLARIATDLTGVLDAKDRYQRLLEALRAAIPYNSAALMRLIGENLVPVAIQGLSATAMTTVFPRKRHPRLDIICGSSAPVRFSSDSSLPDPFDGMLIGAMETMGHIHSCMGCPLHVRDKLVGVLVFDAIDPQAFAQLPLKYIEVIGAIAGAQLQTVELLNRLEKEVEIQGHLTQDLMQDIHNSRGREILGISPAIERLRKEIAMVANTGFTILILGETGVGKELVARAIHDLSPRRTKPMLYLNCAALPESLAESELFGHVKGSFTGATDNRIGKFELADHGTLFLDEIGELSLDIQAKILRTIQEGEVQRIGAERIATVDVRLLAATNRDLAAEVAAGRFRADLFHRLNVYPLRVPPLRDRRDDIPILAEFFAGKARAKLGAGPVRISDDARAMLQHYQWPGNVRELENVISRSLLKSSASAAKGQPVSIEASQLSNDIGEEARSPHLPPATHHPIEPRDSPVSLRDELNNLQRQRIIEALARNQGNWARTSRDLGMNRSNLHNLATRLGLRRKN